MTQHVLHELRCCDMSSDRISQATAQAMRIIREPECKRVTGLSRPQRWRLERKNSFPKRIPISEHSHGWLEHEVQDWIRSRVAAPVAAE